MRREEFAFLTIASLLIVLIISATRERHELLLQMEMKDDRKTACRDSYSKAAREWGWGRKVN
jgi:hypothetical protein